MATADQTGVTYKDETDILGALSKYKWKMKLLKDSPTVCTKVSAGGATSMELFTEVCHRCPLCPQKDLLSHSARVKVQTGKTESFPFTSLGTEVFPWMSSVTFGCCFPSW